MIDARNLRHCAAPIPGFHRSTPVTRSERNGHRPTPRHLSYNQPPLGARNVTAASVQVRNRGAIRNRRAHAVVRSAGVDNLGGHPRRFTEPEMILTSDALYTRLAEIYGMIVFPYEGKFVGLLWILPRGSAHSQQVLRRRHRLPARLPLQRLAGAPCGTRCFPTRSSARPARAPYARSRCWSTSGRSGSTPAPRTGTRPPRRRPRSALLMHRLRLDGFVYLESGPGLLATRPCSCAPATCA